MLDWKGRANPLTATVLEILSVTTSILDRRLEILLGHATEFVKFVLSSASAYFNHEK